MKGNGITVGLTMGTTLSLRTPCSETSHIIDTLYNPSLNNDEDDFRKNRPVIVKNNAEGHFPSGYHTVIKRHNQ